MPTSIPFHVVGISHHTAGVGLRERLALTSEEIADWLQRERSASRSLVLLSTCNRLELYWWGDDDQETGMRVLARERGLFPEPGVVYRRDGLPAIRHLFLVAAGMDSQVLGEQEILGQVRRAHERARAAGTTCGELDAAFGAALAAGRRVRRDTALGRHTASIATAAVAHAKRCCGGSFEGRTVLVLGAGEVAEGMLGALQAEPGGSVVVLNRSPERAAALPPAGTRVEPWDSLGDAVARADVLIAATAAPQPVVSASLLDRAIALRASRPLVVLDLAVPRNVDPSARDLPGVRLFDLDDLRLQHCPAGAGSTPALEEAEALVRDAVGRFRRELRGRAVAPHLAELHRLGDIIAQEEADRALAELEPLSEAERAVVRQMATRLARRLLFPASRKIRESL